jgi:hypothetical protein
MEAKINIVEILKDKPQGTKLYSSACGKCKLEEVDDKRNCSHTELFWKGTHTEDEMINLIKSNQFLSRQFNLKEDKKKEQ